jgi:hypothetical protein
MTGVDRTRMWRNRATIPMPPVRLGPSCRAMRLPHGSECSDQRVGAFRQPSRHQNCARQQSLRPKGSTARLMCWPITVGGMGPGVSATGDADHSEHFVANLECRRLRAALLDHARHVASKCVRQAVFLDGRVFAIPDLEINRVYTGGLHSHQDWDASGSDGSTSSGASTSGPPNR